MAHEQYEYDGMHLYSVKRAARGTKAGNLIAQDVQIYLNAGRWQNNHTDFALVSKRSIARCSWLNYAKEPFEIYKADGKSDPISRFITESELKITCLQWHRVEDKKFRFTGDDELFVFVGDTHIHLFRQCPCDNFVVDVDKYYKHHQKSKTTWQAELEKEPPKSLARDFKEFIDYAANRVPKDYLWQLGDLYEVWEVQAVFDIAFERLMEQVQLKKPKPVRTDLFNEDQRRRWEKARAQMERDIGDDATDADVLMEFFDHLPFSTRDKEQWAYLWARKTRIEDALWLCSSALDLDEQWYAPFAESFTYEGKQILQFCEREDVIAAIRSQYPELKNTWDKFNRIVGNHDSLADNLHLRERYFGKAGNLDKNWTPFDDPDAKNIHPYPYQSDRGPANGLLLGSPKVMCLEHGQAFDPYNNDKNYFRLGTTGKKVKAGAAATTGAVLGAPFGLPGIVVGAGIGLYLVGTGGGALAGGYHSCLGWVKGELLRDTGYVHQAKERIGGVQINGYAGDRAVRIFDRHKGKIHLLVFGHTHQPMIVLNRKEIPRAHGKGL